MKRITFETWLEEYEPIATDNDELKDFHPKVIEDSAEDKKKLENAILEDRVWTLLDTDSGMYITNGLHWVNRIDVYITKFPYEKDRTIEIKY